MVPLLSVHGSIFGPNQWYPMRNLNGLEMLAGVAPLILKCGTLHCVSLRIMKRIAQKDENVHKRSMKLCVGIVCTGLAGFLLNFSLVKHFGVDCESTKNASCLHWSYPIFDVSCDCVMLLLKVFPGDEYTYENQTPFLREIDKYSRVQYLNIVPHNRILSGSETLERIRTKFVLLESIIFSNGLSTQLDFHHHGKTFCFYSAGPKIRKF